MASQSQQTEPPHLLPARGLLILGFLGYLAFLVAGFYRNSPQSSKFLPIYAYLVLLLAVLQIRIPQKPTVLHQAYLLATSGLTAIYAGVVFVGGGSSGFTRLPVTYVVLEGVLIGVFVYDAIVRFLRSRQPANEQTPHPGAGTTSDDDGATSSGRSSSSHQAFVTAAYSAGLAFLFFIFAGLLLALASPDLFRRLDFVYDCPGGKRWSCPYLPPIKLPFTLSLGPMASIHTLDGLNLVLGGFALALALLLIALARLLQSSDASTSLIRFAISAGNEVLVSVRLVLDPLLWLGVASILANLSQQLATYLQPDQPALYDGQRLHLLRDLFWPLSPHSGADLASVLWTVVLGAAAALAVIVAVIIVEHDRTTVERTIQLLARFGRRVAGSLAFFIYSLGVFNFVVCFAGYAFEPFRVGVSGLVAVAAYGVLTGARHRRK